MWRREALRLAALHGASIPRIPGGGQLLLSKRSLPQRCASCARPGVHADPLTNIDLLCLVLQTLQNLAPLTLATTMPTLLITTLCPSQIGPLHHPWQSILSSPSFSQSSHPLSSCTREISTFGCLFTTHTLSKFQSHLGLTADGMLSGSHVASAKSNSRFSEA